MAENNESADELSNFQIGRRVAWDLRYPLIIATLVAAYERFSSLDPIPYSTTLKTFIGTVMSVGWIVAAVFRTTSVERSKQNHRALKASIDELTAKFGAVAARTTTGTSPPFRTRIATSSTPVNTGPSFVVNPESALTEMKIAASLFHRDLAIAINQAILAADHPKPQHDVSALSPYLTNSDLEFLRNLRVVGVRVRADPVEMDPERQKSAIAAFESGRAMLSKVEIGIRAAPK